MKHKVFTLLMAVLSLAVLTIPTSAHHSYQVEFDAKRCADIKGTLTKVDWDNPHIYFYLDATDANGQVSSWTFEGKSLPGLQRSGTHKVDFVQNIGRVLSVRACMAKNGGRRAAAETVTTPDGQVHVVGIDVEHQEGIPQDSYRAHTNN